MSTVPASSQQAIDLIDLHIDVLLAASAIDPGQAEGLQDKLTSAANSLSNGRTQPACGQLQAFINQVNGLLRAGDLSTDEAEALSSAAEAIRAQNAC